ncbi:uncharacterized protein [Nicotiana tomentosiformis]|uniref:uncharacterized protein n=1 Tax=Nicotiana tomentosiformis TaxID=4098 RepID=UPI00388C5004
MVKDFLDYVRRCKAYQFHANFIHQPPEVLHPTVASLPFDAWDWMLLDHCQSPLVGTYTSWLQLTTSQNGLKLLLLRRLMNKIFDLFGFKQRNSSMYNAAANGLAEAFNKTLCNLLKKVISKSKRDWNDRMEEALWAYRMTHRTPTQATPYSLVYEVEAIFPLERQIPSLRLVIQEGITDEENAQLRLANLEALDEKR